MTPAPKEKVLSTESTTPEIPWMLAGWISLLLAVCYLAVIRGLINDWIIDENVGHGFFVPLVAGYVTWQKRDELASVKASPNWFGLVIVVGAALQLYVATLGVEFFLARTALVFSIIGTILFLGGTQVLRVVAFPVFLLFFMIPIPAILYNQITLPLQFLASEVAEIALSLMGIPVLREGNILELPSQKLNVVEACSGIRSLLSLSFLALVYGYFFESRTWIRVLIFLSTVPIAIGANAARVTITGLLSEIDPDLAQGAFHLAEGWVVFVVALALMVLFHTVVVKAAGLAGSGTG